MGDLAGNVGLFSVSPQILYARIRPQATVPQITSRAAHGVESGPISAARWCPRRH